MLTKKDVLIRVVGTAAVLLGLGANALGEWAKDRQMDEIIDRKVDEAITRKTKEAEES